MFVNRETEIARLERVLDSGTAQLVVIYGRRRCGKSTLLKRVMDDNAVLPIVYKHKIIPVLFVKHKPAVTPPGVLIFGPEEIIEGLK